MLEWLCAALPQAVAQGDARGNTCAHTAVESHMLDKDACPVLRLLAQLAPQVLRAPNPQGKTMGHVAVEETDSSVVHDQQPLFACLSEVAPDVWVTKDERGRLPRDLAYDGFPPELAAFSG